MSQCKSVALRTKVGSLIVDAVLDSASSCNTMSMELWNMLSFERDVQENVLRCTDSSRMIYAKDVPLCIPTFFIGIKFALDFQIVDGAEPLILGIDFLKKAKVVMDVKNKKIAVKGVILPLFLYTSFDTSITYICKIKRGMLMHANH